jgi:hypothetical protein
MGVPTGVAWVERPFYLRRGGGPGVNTDGHGQGWKVDGVDWVDWVDGADGVDGAG